MNINKKDVAAILIFIALIIAFVFLINNDEAPVDFRGAIFCKKLCRIRLSSDCYKYTFCADRNFFFLLIGICNL